MADLISRAAAIEAFDDERVDRYYGDVSPESVIGVIESIPAVDAIPVEWLHKKREQMIDAAQNTPEQAIAYVLWLWKKEQEA